jgi:hypothetical protein
VPEDRSGTYARHVGDLIDGGIEASLGDDLHGGTPNARPCEPLLLLCERKRTLSWLSHSHPRSVPAPVEAPRHCTWTLGIRPGTVDPPPDSEFQVAGLFPAHRRKAVDRGEPFIGPRPDGRTVAQGPEGCSETFSIVA